MNYRLVLSNLKIVEFQVLMTVDNNILSRDLGGFPEMTPGRKIIFDLSIFDIQWENKGYSICHIVQNNDLHAHGIKISARFVETMAKFQLRLLSMMIFLHIIVILLLQFCRLVCEMKSHHGLMTWNFSLGWKFPSYNQTLRWSFLQK